jgi:hypothetical protein
MMASSRARCGWLVAAALALAVAGALGARTDARALSGRAPVSTVVFPESPRVLRAAHAHPAHARLRCERGHVGATESERAGDSLTPREDACLPCHVREIDRDEPSAERCGFCHVGYGTGTGISGRSLVPAATRAPPRLHFSHEVHAARGVRCLSCHEGVNEDPEDLAGAFAPARHLPSMRSCFTCHGGATPTAPTACATCHVALPDGRLRSRFGDARMNPPSWLFDMRHDEDFIVRHRWVGADQGELCAACHTETDCQDCHDGRVRPVARVHPNDYLTIHPQMARRDEPRCTSCHSTQSFCAECHARLGVARVAAVDVRNAARFHPPADVWLRGPVLHGREARRSMTACASCHVESDCVDCHGAPGIGVGVSPHPPGFRDRCGLLLRTNDRPCRTCHGDVEAVRALCGG